MPAPAFVSPAPLGHRCPALGARPARCNPIVACSFEFVRLRDSSLRQHARSARPEHPEAVVHAHCPRTVDSPYDIRAPVASHRPRTHYNVIFRLLIAVITIIVIRSHLGSSVKVVCEGSLVMKHAASKPRVFLRPSASGGSRSGAKRSKTVSERTSSAARHVSEEASAATGQAVGGCVCGKPKPARSQV